MNREVSYRVFLFEARVIGQESSPLRPCYEVQGAHNSQNVPLVDISRVNGGVGKAHVVPRSARIPPHNELAVCA